MMPEMLQAPGFFADIPNKNVFSLSGSNWKKPKFLVEDRIFRMFGNVFVYGAEVPSLASRFLCLQAEAHQNSASTMLREIFLFSLERTSTLVLKPPFARDVRRSSKPGNVKTNYTIRWTAQIY